MKIGASHLVRRSGLASAATKARGGGARLYLQSSSFYIGRLRIATCGHVIPRNLFFHTVPD
jgi:hypothetical protein